MATNTPLWQLAIFMLSALVAVAQAAESPPPRTPAATPSDAKPFKNEELEAIVAPIALYPDSLLAQIFMASTYPLEIVQADRWATENKALKGDALTAELEKKTWDPSVKSLVNFPQVLAMMSKDLEWTTKLGDAFIANQAAVMGAVQKLRAKAQAQGNLKDTPEQKIIVEQAAPTVIVEGAAPPPQIIKIESPSPQVVYVPTYNPTVVYGPWPYPAYPPPPPYYPPGYVASNLVSFGLGVAAGAAWGYAWGGCNWGHGDVDIDIDRNANINRNINRENYKANLQNRSANVQGGRSTFQHDPAHRKGVSYRDPATARKVGQTGNLDAARARESYRGRAEAGRQDLSRGGADQFRGTGGVGREGTRGTPGRPEAGALPADRGRTDAARARPEAGRTGAGADRPSGTPSRSPTPSQSRGGAFEGADRGGAAARSSSSRGQASRSAPSRPSPSRAPSGGFRSGGGRAGGGRR